MTRGLKIVFYTAAFLAALSVTAYLTTYFLVKGEPEVTVPDLRGRKRSWL